MKRCPKCNRIESDDALAFCRLDGTTLIKYSDTVSAEAGTLKFAATHVATEQKTDVLRHAADDGIIRNTAVTTLLAHDRTHGVSRNAARLKLRAGLPIIAGLIVGTLAVAAYLYFARTAKPSIDSVAVLPLLNAGGDPNTEYLSDGISEALINSLTELQQLRVIARATSFRYKGRDVDPQTVGRELNVGSVLTGSVRQAGDNMAIQVDLVDATTGTQLWGHQYERKVSDLLSVKQAIAREVADKLRLRLSGDEQKQLTRRDTTNAEAYQAYLKGRYYWNKRTADSLKRAIEQFQEAIDRDPGFALGYVGLADCYVAQEHYSGIASSEILPKARAAVDRALAIDESLSEAHTTSASIYQRQWRWTETEDELRRAISLNPNYPTAHHFYAYYFYIKRRFDDAMREIKRAHELDPLSPVISENVAMVDMLRGDLDSAITEGLRTIELDPKFADAHYVLAFAYLKRGRHEDATAEFQKAVELSGRAGTYLGNLGYCYAVTGKRTEALTTLKELQEKYSNDESSGLFVAGVYAGLGDKDKAFNWLEKDFQQRNGQLPTMVWRPHFENLRSDPRYFDLVRGMGLAP
jgi:TolB-like protein/Tfp pilus assembly protein PilF